MNYTTLSLSKVFIAVYAAILIATYLHGLLGLAAAPAPLAEVQQGWKMTPEPVTNPWPLPTVRPVHRNDLLRQGEMAGE